MKYQIILSFLLILAKQSKWRVIFRKNLPSYVDGYITPKIRTITIEKNHTDKRKCIILAHELLGHAQQWDSKDKKWRRYFSEYKLPNTKRNLEYVASVEIDASKRGAKFLKSVGFKDADSYFEELNKKEIIWLKPYWGEMYLKPKKK